MTPLALQALVEKTARLTPADLPPVPWVLKASERQAMEKGLFKGGPYATVIDNEAWLRSIQLDLKAGAGGARARTGAIQGDLEALEGILVARKKGTA